MSGKPRITRKPISRRKTRYCPICTGKLKHALGLSGWLLPDEFVCPTCGYRGPIGLEKED